MEVKWVFFLLRVRVSRVRPGCWVRPSEVHQTHTPRHPGGPRESERWCVVIGLHCGDHVQGRREQRRLPGVREAGQEVTSNRTPRPAAFMVERAPHAPAGGEGALRPVLGARAPCGATVLSDSGHVSASPCGTRGVALGSSRHPQGAVWPSGCRAGPAVHAPSPRAEAVADV